MSYCYKRDRLLAILIVALMPYLCMANAPSDNFNNNIIDNFWFLYEQNHSQCWLEETNQRLEFRTRSSSSGENAFYVSKDWRLDLTQDFLIRVDYHYSALTVPDTGIFLMFSKGMGPENSITYSAGCYNNYPYSWLETRVNNSYLNSEGDARGEVGGTFYLSYNSSIDTLYLSNDGYGSKNAWKTVSNVMQGQWGLSSVYVGIAGYCRGVEIGAGQAYFDNFSIDYGKVNWLEGSSVQYNLTLDSIGNGQILPGEGTQQYNQGEDVVVEAVADSYWRFTGWTGTAVEANAVADLHEPITTVTLLDNYTLTANFEPVDVNYPGLGYSLGTIPFEDQAQFDNLIVRNDDALVSFVTGLQPDPTGMMQMQAQAGQAAIAKAGFEQTSQEKIQIEFNYLFTEDNPGMELVVYLSDVPDLFALDDAQREDHYREVGVLTVPEAGRPGSVGSERFGTFSSAVDPNGLDLTHGSYLELALRINQLVSTDVFAIPLKRYVTRLWFCLG